MAFFNTGKIDVASTGMRLVALRALGRRRISGENSATPKNGADFMLLNAIFQMNTLKSLEDKAIRNKVLKINKMLKLLLF